MMLDGLSGDDGVKGGEGKRKRKRKTHGACRFIAEVLGRDGREEEGEGAGG